MLTTYWSTFRRVLVRFHALCCRAGALLRGSAPCAADLCRRCCDAARPMWGTGIGAGRPGGTTGRTLNAPTSDQLQDIIAGASHVVAAVAAVNEQGNAPRTLAHSSTQGTRAIDAADASTAAARDTLAADINAGRYSMDDVIAALGDTVKQLRERDADVNNVRERQLESDSPYGTAPRRGVRGTAQALVNAMSRVSRHVMEGKGVECRLLRECGKCDECPGADGGARRTARVLVAYNGSGYIRLCSQCDRSKHRTMRALRRVTLVSRPVAAAPEPPSPSSPSAGGAAEEQGGGEARGLDGSSGAASVALVLTELRPTTFISPAVPVGTNDDAWPVAADLADGASSRGRLSSGTRRDAR